MSLNSIIFVLLTAAALLHFYFNFRLDVLLRRSHPNAWDQLGRPSFLNNSPANSVRFLKYIVFGTGFKELNDPKINSYVRVLRTTFFLFLLFLIAGIWSVLAG